MYIWEPRHLSFLIGLLVLCALSMSFSASFLIGDVTPEDQDHDDSQEDQDHDEIASLIWLAGHQMDNGRWDLYQYTQQCHEYNRCNRITGGTSRRYMTAVTGMTVRSFLSSGFTHLSTEQVHEGHNFGKTVKKGLYWLYQQQNDSGQFRNPVGDADLYNHVIATGAFVHGFRLTGSVMLRDIAQRAIQYLENAQNKKGAWGTTVRDPETDMLVTRWSYRVLYFASKVHLHNGTNLDRLPDVLESKRSVPDLSPFVPRDRLLQLNSYHAAEDTHQTGSWDPSSHSLIESKVGGRIMKTALYSIRPFSNKGEGPEYIHRLPIRRIPANRRVSPEKIKRMNRLWRRFKEHGLKEAMDKRTEWPQRDGGYSYCSSLFSALRCFRRNNQRRAIDHLENVQRALQFFPDEHQKTWHQRALRQDEIRAWINNRIRALGKPSYRARERATRVLHRLNRLLRVRLKPLLKSQNPEVRLRAKRILAVPAQK